MKFIKYILVLAIVFSSCKGKETQEGESKDDASEVIVEKSDAVCIAAISLRKDPARTKDNYLLTINIGEKVLYLGTSKEDTTTNRTYHNVELSDGKTGWAQDYGILINAKPAALVNKTPIYKRPDLVTKSSKELNIMDYVAIVDEKNEWVEIVSANRKKKGWIPAKKITTKTEDVATAILAINALYGKNGEIQIEKVQSFLEELPYDNTQFKGYLQEMLDAQVGEAIEESIETYVEEEV